MADGLLAGGSVLAGVIVGAGVSELLDWMRRRRLGRAAVGSLWREIADVGAPLSLLIVGRKFAPEEPEFVFPTFYERQTALTATLTTEELDFLARVIGFGAAKMMTTQYLRVQAEARDAGKVAADHPSLVDLGDWRTELMLAGRLLDARRQLSFWSRFSLHKEERKERERRLETIQHVVIAERDRRRRLIEEAHAGEDEA